MDASFGIVRDNGQEGMVSPRGSFSIQIADSHALKYFIYLISIEVHDVFRRFLVKNCQELRRDVVCCSSAISCIGGQRRWQHALQLLQQMLEPGSNGGFSIFSHLSQLFHLICFSVPLLFLKKLYSTILLPELLLLPFEFEGVFSQANTPNGLRMSQTTFGRDKLQRIQ